MRRRFAALSLLACAAAAACDTSVEPQRTDARSSAIATPKEAFYVVLEGVPAIERVPAGVDPRSAQAAAIIHARLAELEDQHAALRPALAAEGAEVIAEMSRLANVIQILADREQAERIERLPAVVRIELVPLARPSLGSAVPVVGAPSVWSSATPFQGDGIVVGIIDSGVDYTHADFGGPGTVEAYLANDPEAIEPGTFPTARVVGGWDLVGDDYNPDGGKPGPSPDPDPLDCTQPENPEIAGGHGTHVAGIAAGNGVTQTGAAFGGPYEASFDPASFRVAPGVAPRASLYALRIFGCAGSTTMLGPALERAADPNLDGNLDDRLDVVNASLGTAYALGSPVNQQLARNLTKAGTLMVAAAGNEGQTFFATSSPGSYPEVLSVAASADNEFVTLAVTGPTPASYPAAEGGFTVRLVDFGPLTGELVAASPALGCSAFTNAASIAGKIALIDRGTCPFVDKFANAVAAGAIGAVIIDNEDDPLPFAMGGGDPGSISIPGVLVRQADGVALEAALAAGPVNISLDPANAFVGAGAELLAGFSARGPSSSDGRLKPEIAAPGFSIDSARVGSGTEPRRSQGTSMASPMVAGAAALVRQAQPNLSPLEAKAALVNAGQTLLNLSSQPYGTSVVGGGRLDVARAVAQQVTAVADSTTGEVGVSFGAIVSDQPATVKRTITVTNHGSSEASLTATVEPTFEQNGVAVSTSVPSIDVAAGQTATFELTLAFDPEMLGSPEVDPGTTATQGGQNPLPRQYLNEATGVVRLSGGAAAPSLVVPYNGSVRAAVSRKATPPSACDAPSAAGEPIEVGLVGGGAHPQPVVSAFQLGTLDEASQAGETDPVKAMIDLRAVGAASDLPTAPSFGEAMVHFGVAVTGTWTTAARGPLSVVGIEIDVDDDPGAEFAVRAEPRNPDGPFRDALMASTYDLATGERVDRVPLNGVGPDLAKTYPFHNSVLVLSTHLEMLKLDPARASFRYAGVTENPEQLTKGERTTWVTFDAAKPILDTTTHGLERAPIFVGAGPILVGVAAELDAQTPLDLLVLHHTNVVDQRFEVISLARPTAGNLSVTSSAPTTVGAADTQEVTLTVSHAGPEPAAEVTLKGSLQGGLLLAAATTQGSCTKGSTLSCELGELAGGESVTVTATVRPAAGSATVALDADVSSSLACETATDDNHSATTLSVGADPKAEAPQARAAGGCGCRVADAPSTTPYAAWLWLAAATLLAGRARRSTP